MRYAYFREHGMFVGSGTVEAGCKAIIGQRLKLSGMRWNIPGATAILTLRCQEASGRWDQIWRKRAIVNTCGSRSLRGLLSVRFVGAFDEFAVVECCAGTNECDQVRRVHGAPA